MNIFEKILLYIIFVFSIFYVINLCVKKLNAVWIKCEIVTTTFTCISVGIVAQMLFYFKYIIISMFISIILICIWYFTNDFKRSIRDLFYYSFFNFIIFIIIFIFLFFHLIPADIQLNCLCVSLIFFWDFVFLSVSVFELIIVRKVKK